MTKQTDLKRKASARKGQATQQRNAASRARSTEKTARARVEAERQQAMAGAFTAARAVDVTLGGAESARDRVADAFRDIADPGTLLRKGTESARQTVDRFEDRGAVTRRKIGRDVKRRAKEARDMVPL